jgi:hypothetical protein
MVRCLTTVCTVVGRRVICRRRRPVARGPRGVRAPSR